MFYSFFPSLLSFTFILSLTGVYLMIRLGVMDIPGHRSSHQTPVPKGGGIGVLTAYLVGIAIIMVFQFFPTLDNNLFALCTALAILGVFSWLDDIYQWPALLKLGVQIITSVYLVGEGYHFPFWNFSFWTQGNADMSSITQGVWVVLSVLWLVFVINAINFMDGLNGLVSGCMALACLLVGIGLFNTFPPQPLALLFWAALMGFIPFNYPRAKIFLGDVGSQTGGMLMGALTFMSAHYPYAPYWSLLTIPLILSPLFYDTIFTLLRRKIAGEKLLKAHRGHLYQLAQRSGIPASMVSLIEWFFCLYGAIVCWVGFRLPLAQALALASTVIFLQLLWTIFIVYRSKKVDIGQW